MADNNTLGLQYQRQQEQRHAMEINRNCKKSDENNAPFQHLRHTMGTAHEDLLFQHADMIFHDIRIPNSKTDILDSYESACKDGSLSTVKDIITSEPHTSFFPNQGLILALQTGNLEIAKYLLSAGAPISRITAIQILSAPSSQWIPLFELIFEHGWTPNTPGFYGRVLLPDFVTHTSLLRWFLSHGANPNLGAQRDHRDRLGESEIDSCAALEAAVGTADVETVRLVIDSGAKIENGYPLHSAVGVFPCGTNPHTALVTISREFDIDRIPIMDLLVSHGADVNQKEESR